MQENYVDLRVVRTKRAIRNALVELMGEKDFEKITVKDITIRANINRGTFYIHYEDKLNLMKKCQEEVMREMTQIIKTNMPDLLDKVERNQESTFSLDVAVIIFKYIKENSQFMKGILRTQGDASFRMTFKDFLWKNLFEHHKSSLVDEKYLLVPKEYLISYIVSAYLGVIQHWLNGGMKESPEEMAFILLTLVDKRPFEVVGFRHN